VWTLSAGVPIGCRSPRKRGLYSMPKHSSGQPDYCCSARWRVPPPGSHKPPPLHPQLHEPWSPQPNCRPLQTWLHFKAVSITLQPDEKSDVSAANGILYQPSSANDRAADLCAVEWQSLSAFADLNRQIALRGARQSPETLANPKTRDHRVQEEMRPPPQPKLAESSARLPPITGCGRRTNQPPALNDWQSVCDHQMGDASHDRVEEFD
jgi:hypothetical protein